MCIFLHLLFIVYVYVYVYMYVCMSACMYVLYCIVCIHVLKPLILFHSKALQIVTSEKDVTLTLFVDTKIIYKKKVVLGCERRERKMMMLGGSSLSKEESCEGKERKWMGTEGRDGSDLMRM